jgi:hypothetical protein
VVVMNPQISLDNFIPPLPDFDYVNIVFTQDSHGLNDGVFLIKVNVWSVKLLSGVIALHTFEPEKELKYSEQSSLEALIVQHVSQVIRFSRILNLIFASQPYWSRSAVEVPQNWFNSYPAVEKDHPEDFEFRTGGYQAHFAGNKNGKRPELMKAWMDIADQNLPQYSKPVDETPLAKEMKAFWDDLAQERKREGLPNTDAKEREEAITDHNIITDPW